MPPTTDTTVLYLTPMVFPNQKAHSVQITRTVTALARLVPVVLVVKRLDGEGASIRECIESVYGCAVPANLRVVQIPEPLFSTPGFPFLLKRVRCLIETSDWVFYTRSYNLARRLTRFRVLHGRRIFFESHKKNGFAKEDPVFGSKYAALREARERENQSRALIRRVYEQADTTFFLHRHSEQWARAHLGLKNTEFLWYGLKQLSYPRFAERPHFFVYCGSLSNDRLFDLLIDAAKVAGDWLRIDVFGGNARDIASRKSQLAALDLLGRFEFKGYVNSAVLSRHLQSYRFGISMVEGMKVVDYVENGIIPVIPSIPSFLDVFDASSAVFFEPDSDRALCAALRACRSADRDNGVLQKLIGDYSLANRAAKIARHL